MTLLQLSDLHLRAASGRDGPAARLEHAVGRAATLRPAPEAVLLSGDIADAPSREVYDLAHELLAPLGVPLHAIPGKPRRPRSAA